VFPITVIGNTKNTKYGIEKAKDIRKQKAAFSGANAGQGRLRAKGFGGTAERREKAGVWLDKSVRVKVWAPTKGEY
jgi:hypothetical protein